MPAWAVQVVVATTLAPGGRLVASVTQFVPPRLKPVWKLLSAATGTAPWFRIVAVIVTVSPAFGVDGEALRPLTTRSGFAARTCTVAERVLLLSSASPAAPALSAVTVKLTSPWGAADQAEALVTQASSPGASAATAAAWAAAAPAWKDT